MNIPELKTPTPQEIKEARMASGLTQQQAAQVIGRATNMSWSRPERGEGEMDAAAFAYFQLVTGQRRLERIKP